MQILVLVWVDPQVSLWGKNEHFKDLIQAHMYMEIVQESQRQLYLCLWNF